MIPNYLSPLEFKVTIGRLPNVEFFTQQTSIPGISSSPIMVPTRFNKSFHAGDEVEFSNLDLTFIIDEAMSNYKELFDWIMALNFPDSHQQFESLGGNLTSDISVIVLNSKKNPNIEFQFQNCFPISLSDVSLNTTDTDVTYPQATASFQYDAFKMKMISP
jgi:hypothetical protein